MWAVRTRAKVAFDRARSWFGVPLDCQPRGSGGRASPDDRLRFTVAGRDVLLCYGRPFARGRRIFGGVVPYGELWRTGANEPTVLHLPFATEIASVRVPRGKYALYTVPGPQEWTLVINRSTRQWGLTREEQGSDGRSYPNAYKAWVKAAELGRATILARSIPRVEQLTARAEVQDAVTTLLLFEWEATQVRIPIRARGATRA